METRNPHLEHLFGIFGGIRAAGHNDGGRLVQLSNLFCHRQTIHQRHLDVRQHNLRTVFFK